MACAFTHLIDHSNIGNSSSARNFWVAIRGVVNLTQLSGPTRQTAGILLRINLQECHYRPCGAVLLSSLSVTDVWLYLMLNV